MADAKIYKIQEKLDVLIKLLADHLKFCCNYLDYVASAGRYQAGVSWTKQSST